LKTLKPSFRDYVRSSDALETSAGDFVRDVRDDPDFPDVKSAKALYRYLKGCDADPSVFWAALAFWDRYRRIR
jgi:hypothetical protein